MHAPASLTRASSWRCVLFFEAGGDGAEMLAEEALDEVAVSIGEGAEGGAPPAAGHGLDVGPAGRSKDG